jgi:hypothetical protein
MDIEVQRYLYDIQSAGELIQTFVAAQTFTATAPMPCCDRL